MYRTSSAHHISDSLNSCPRFEALSDPVRCFLGFVQHLFHELLKQAGQTDIIVLD
jgi:hypothetical protein